jgi:hypothetical protein
MVHNEQRQRRIRNNEGPQTQALRDNDHYSFVGSGRSHGISAREGRGSSWQSVVNFRPKYGSAAIDCCTRYRRGTALLVLSTTLFCVFSVTLYGSESWAGISADRDVGAPSLRGVDVEKANNPKSQPPSSEILNVESGIGLLSTSDLVSSITTDVRGNLGPAQVMLQNGTDWIRDRWQAASDMHGTNIQGAHWVEIHFKSPISHISRVVLDWEAAYSDNYEIQVSRNSDAAQTTGNSSSSRIVWETIFSAPNPDAMIVTQFGQSPGVSEPTPLHVVHDIRESNSLTLFRSTEVATNKIRLLIKKSTTGWGVSLWQIQVYGQYTKSALSLLHSE